MYRKQRIEITQYEQRENEQEIQSLRDLYVLKKKKEQKRKDLTFLSSKSW